MNHTVCVSSDGQHVWSFGDGDFGKLGLGSIATKHCPQRIEALAGMRIRKVQCGTQVTVFLTDDGKVYSCGMDRLIGRPDARARSHTKPQLVSYLNY